MQQIFIKKSATFFVFQNATVLLKNATVLTKCDDFFTKCDSHYKMRCLIQNTSVQPSKTDIYFREFMKDKTLHY